MRCQVLCFFVLLVSTVIAASAQKPVEKARIFQWCPFHCETIRINTDFTFDYLLDGDLYNMERTSGKWEFLDDGRIKVESNKQKLLQRFVESKEANIKGVRVVAMDVAGALFAVIKVVAVTAEGTEECVTDQDGACDLPPATRLHFEFTDYEDTIDLVNPDSTQVNIEIGHLSPHISAHFILKKDSLCKVLDSPAEPLCYREISGKKGERLFPKAGKKR